LIEKDSKLGGAWKSIDVCGIKNVDLGCHQVGSNEELYKFLQEYIGCNLVSLDNPKMSFEQNKGSNGFYFSKGCFELIDQLQKLIQKAQIPIFYNTALEEIFPDSISKEVTLRTTNQTFCVKKVFLTPMTSITQSNNAHKSRHYHLYLLIQDETDPKFSYLQKRITTGITRIINLTHFTNLLGSGKQMIVIQTQGEQFLKNSDDFLNALKKENLIDMQAVILNEDTFIYESGSFHNTFKNESDLVEVIQTGHIQKLAQFIPKWKEVFKPYTQTMQN
jgi:hypothetical protein